MREWEKGDDIRGDGPKGGCEMRVITSTYYKVWRDVEIGRCLGGWKFQALGMMIANKSTM